MRETVQRWVLLEHSGAPDDPQGIHFDLLLEDGSGCRTWRLPKVPVRDGPSLKVHPMPIHRLVWLDRADGPVSGGRGWIRKVIGGYFEGELPLDDSEVGIDLYASNFWGRLEISNSFCSLRKMSLFKPEEVKNS